MLSMRELEKLATDISNEYGKFEYGLLKEIILILSKYENFDQANAQIRKIAIAQKGAILTPALKITEELIDVKTAEVMAEIVKKSGVSVADLPVLRKLKTSAMIEINETLINAYNSTFRRAQQSALKISTYADINRGIKKEINNIVSEGVIVNKGGKAFELFAETNRIALNHYQKTNLQTLKEISKIKKAPDLIIISQHTNASPDHALYQGRIYINDIEAI